MPLHPTAHLPSKQMDVEQLVAEYRRTGRDMLAQRAAAASGLPPHPKRGKGSKGGGVKQEEGAAAGAEVKEEEGEEGMDVDVKAEGEDADGRQQTAATAAGGSEQGGEEAEGPAAKTGGKKHRSAEPEAAARQAGGAAPPADPGHRTQGTFALRPVAAPLPGEVLGSPLAKTPGGGEQGKVRAGWSWAGRCVKCYGSGAASLSLTVQTHAPSVGSSAHQPSCHAPALKSPCLPLRLLPASPPLRHADPGSRRGPADWVPHQAQRV